MIASPLTATKTPTELYTVEVNEFPQSHPFAKWISIFVIALFALFTAPAAIAQSSGEVSGTVTDATGAIISNATVTLRNLATNAERQVKTDSAGIYAFTNVQPAQYTVTATSSGFGTTKLDIVVAIGGHVTADEKLQVSNNAVTIDIAATQNAQVNTQTPEVSQVIDQEQISRRMLFPDHWRLQSSRSSDIAFLLLC